MKKLAKKGWIIVHNLNVCLSVLLLCVYVFYLFVASHVWALLPEIKLID